MPLAARLAAVWDHLELDTAHVATQMPGDIAGLVAAAPGRIAGLVLCAPTRLDAVPLSGLADRILMIAGDRGATGEATARAVSRLPGAERVLLDRYEAFGWADVVADRTDAVVTPMLAFLDRVAAAGHQAATPRDLRPSGSHAGISYTVEGQGPALVLLPFFLAPSQWSPAVPVLARHFTVIRLGGAHVGGVAALEDRARAPTYQAMIRTLFDLIAPLPGETILDVGCGSGANDRMLAWRYGAANPITATDVNPFLLHEAGVLAEAEGLLGAIRFQQGNAEALPFADAAFDCAFSVTVLEECDADRALAELRRVVRPGGRVGVVVRSIDLRQWWNLPLSASLRERVETPPASVGPAGVADAGLYPRMRAAGFTELTCFPFLVTLDNAEGPIWRFREDHIRAQLSGADLVEWEASTKAARDAGLLFMAHPLHCAVGVR